MTERQTRPGEFYRRLVADLCHDRITAGDDALERYLEKALEEVSAEPEPSLTRYILATGLLAFGRGEMVEIILANVPKIPSEGVGGKVLYLGRQRLARAIAVARAASR